jgi:energy-coupling factor transporter transmembrane protein EcfT
MEAKGVDEQPRHWIALVTSVFLKHSWWFMAAIGVGVAYYVRAAFGYDRFFEVMFTSGEGLAFIAAVFTSVIIQKPAADLFYGAELAAEAREKKIGRGLSFPDPSNFYPTMTRQIGVLRKSSGYVYAITTLFYYFWMGGAFGAYLLTYPLVRW